MVDHISLPRMDFGYSVRCHIQSTILNWYNYCFQFLLFSSIKAKEFLQLVLNINCDKTVFVFLFSLLRFTSYASETRKKIKLNSQHKGLLVLMKIPYTFINPFVMFTFHQGLKIRIIRPGNRTASTRSTVGHLCLM